jgi:hypothetical protein
MLGRHWLFRSITVLRQIRLIKPQCRSQSSIYSVSSNLEQSVVRCRSTFFQSRRYFATVAAPDEAALFEPIKQFIKNELLATKQEYSRGNISNWLAKECYDELIKVVSNAIKQLEGCGSESAFKALYQDEAFNTLLDKHTNIALYQGEGKHKKPYAWEEVKRQITDLIKRNLTCPKPGLYG